MKRAIALVVVASLVGLPSAGVAAETQQAPAKGRLNIAHDPLQCVSPDYRPVVDAKVMPQKEMDRSYVYFREKGTEDFYYVIMKPQATEVVGELPRPLPSMRGVDYYVQALDVARAPTKTGEYGPNLDPSCGTRKTTSGEGLTVGLTREGQNPVPAGFNKDDIAKVILVSGAVVGLGAALQAFSAGGGAAVGTTGATTGTTGAATGTAAGAGAGTGAGTAALAAGLAAAAIGGGLVIANNTGSVSGPPVSPSRPTSSRRD